MNPAKTLARISRSQAKNVLNWVSGKPLTTPSLSSMTLDRDDVELAIELLAARSRSDSKGVSHEWDQTVVSEYEAEFARWNNSKYAFAFMAGRIALSACIYAIDLQPQDEVILPGYTCVVVPNAFHFAGIKTVYCDIELDTYGLDVTQIESKITYKTRAILLHHLYGLVCRDYQAILDLAKRYDLKVIEDCAHATGAEYQGRKVGNFGDVAFYSSEQSKVFNTIQGGIAVTNDDQLAKKFREYYQQAAFPDEVWIERQLHNVILNFYQFKHPQRWWLGDIYEAFYGNKRLISTTKDEEQGIYPDNYARKMPAAIAALGLNQLKKIDYYNERRRQTAKSWQQWCDRHDYHPPVVIDHSIPIYLRYPVLVEQEKKQNFSWAVKELKILPGVWFVNHIHPSQQVSGCPNADRAVKQCINFPCLLT
ncbi:MAG TPA: DegT/DnrJ/EryC1/StrS family aminotransferase [Oculatellaceae cyanobacterium]|jgi:dTDP-4-amino-4,6-dideoxygalactose transaminase